MPTKKGYWQILTVIEINRQGAQWVRFGHLETDTCTCKDLLQNFSGNSNKWGKKVSYIINAAKTVDNVVKIVFVEWNGMNE